MSIDGYRMDSFAGSQIETFTLFEQKKLKDDDKIHFFALQKIDFSNGRVFLVPLDPKKQYTKEQLLEYGLSCKVVSLSPIKGKFYIMMVSKLFKDKIPTSKLEIFIQEWKEDEPICKIYEIQYLDGKEYTVALQNYAQFGRLVAAQLKKQAVAVK